MTALRGGGEPAIVPRSLTAGLKRAREILRQGGARLLVLKVLGETVLRPEVMLAFDLREPAEPPASRLALDFEYLGGREIDEYLEFHPFAHRDEIVTRLARAERCLVARRRGRMVSAVWCAPRGAPIADLALWLRLAPGEVYVYDTFTEPAHRGWGVYPALSFELARRLGEDGYVRMIGVVRLDADRARRAHEQSGFQPFGSVGWIKLGPLQRDFQLCRRERRGAGALRRRSPLWKGLRLREIDLQTPRLVRDPGLPVEFAHLEEHGIAEYLAFRPTASRDDIVSRLARGERCVMARLDARVVSAAWVATEGTWDARHGLWVRLAYGEAYVYDRYTAPEHRSPGVSHVLAQRVLNDLTRAGYERAVFPADGSRDEDWGSSAGRALGRTGTIALGGWAREVAYTRRRAGPG